MTDRMITDVRVAIRRWGMGNTHGRVLFSADLYVNDDTDPALKISGERCKLGNCVVLTVGLAEKIGILPPCTRPSDPHGYCADHHINLTVDVTDVPHKKDL